MFPIFTNTGLSHEYLTRALPYYQLLHIFLESHPIFNLVVKIYQLVDTLNRLNQIKINISYFQSLSVILNCLTWIEVLSSFTWLSATLS
ncbi:hypothetical protein PGT21_035899 [Puccinia graminis f. sp. tritici]|uniref:Uncharacterized protein n=1 Tax=Puccinia graminis f. sp. tritici TaxID=56615 RepID=A0A5B0QDM0_PUCGR|nr:hypothetical protein PGT21_035899 [Puccinia graminis f. sp. tritici]